MEKKIENDAELEFLEKTIDFSKDQDELLEKTIEIPVQDEISSESEHQVEEIVQPKSMIPTPSARKQLLSPLPVLFLGSIFVFSLLNYQNFTDTLADSLEKTTDNTQQALQTVETNFADEFVGKTNFLNINGLFTRILNKVELNERFRLKNGHVTSYLTTNFNENGDDFVISSITGDHAPSDTDVFNLTRTNNYLKMYDIPFGFVQTPHLFTTDFDDTIPAGYTTYVNRNTDVMLVGLKKNKISYLDLRENIKENQWSHYDLFYKTDHHWTIETAFWSVTPIVNYVDSLLNNKYSTDFFNNTANYDVITYPDSLLGSSGQRVGIYFTEVDDISLYLPRFETKITVETPSKNEKITGAFHEVHLNMSIIEEELKNSYTQNTYMVYPLHHDYSIITNHKSTNNIKVMVLRDSFFGPVAPYFALHYSETHLYDLRYGSMTEFYELLHEIQPDVVIQVKNTNPSLPLVALEELGSW